MPATNRRSADASVIAAVNHPLRRRVLDLLAIDGPATASQLAQVTGELVGNISHHLKVLATAGAVEEAPELAKNRRERWWRSARVFGTESWVTLTPDRLDELGRRMDDLIREYIENPSEGTDAHPVFVFAHGVPARP